MKKIPIALNVLQATVDYLVKRPFNEVSDLITAIQAESVAHDAIEKAAAAETDKAATKKVKIDGRASS